ncbi:MAG: hypothetical protein OSB69_09795 [Alphaproteobacteria bacterium]|nr:hypothetical protein [Alphaproteobacteria bacterium]
MGGGIPRRALLTAVVLGSLLTMVNHGDLTLVGYWPPVWKIALTY